MRRTTMTKTIGYVRVSTDDQDFSMQIDALHKEGVLEKNIFKEKISAVKKERPQFKKCLKTLQKGDTLVVWKLDRLGRSVTELIEIMNNLKKRGVFIKILTESIDTTTPGGTLIFHIFASLAEFERGIIRERTKAGLKAARARGRIGGRPKINPEGKYTKNIKQMYATGCSARMIAQMLGISTRTVFRRLAC